MDAGWRSLALCVFFASLGVNAVLALRDASWWIAPAMLAGWYVADAATGLVHMYMDYRPCRPGGGMADLFFYQGSRESADYLELRRTVMRRHGPFERLVFDFKNHHPRPDALGRRGFRTLTESTLLGALPASLALSAGAATGVIPGWAIAGIATFTLGGALSQYFHATLHRPDPGWAIRLMRRTGLLMTPAAHERHHASLRRDFATNSGWSNALLNPVFRHMHRRGILTDAGLEPR